MPCANETSYKRKTRQYLLYLSLKAFSKHNEAQRLRDNSNLQKSTLAAWAQSEPLRSNVCIIPLRQVKGTIQKKHMLYTIVLRGERIIMYRTYWCIPLELRKTLPHQV